MRHVAALSPLFSLDCAYFLSPRGCVYPFTQSGSREGPALQICRIRASSDCGVGAGDEENRKEIEKEQQAEIRFGLAVGAAKFLPDEHAPEGSDHWRRLSDRIGNGDPGKSRGDEIEDRAEAPNAAAQKSEQMTCGGPAKQIAETNGYTDERFLHEVNIPEETGKQRAQSKEDPNTVRAEGVPTCHGAGNERRPKSHQDARDDAGDDALFGDGAVYVGKVAVGFAVQNDRDHRAKHTCSQHAGVPLRLQNVAGDDAYDQCDTDGNREGDG